MVGLQEVATWERLDEAKPGGGFVMAYDFESLLLGDLAADGAPYSVAEANSTFQVAALIDATTLVRFTDYNVILVRAHDEASLAPSDAQQGRYTARIPITVLGSPVAITRGWGSVDVNAGGRRVRFFTTHPRGLQRPGAQRAGHGTDGPPSGRRGARRCDRRHQLGAAVLPGRFGGLLAAGGPVCGGVAVGPPR